jgi:hypothetical protein
MANQTGGRAYALGARGSCRCLARPMLGGDLMGFLVTHQSFCGARHALRPSPTRSFPSAPCRPFPFRRWHAERPGADRVEAQARRATP